MSLVTLRIVLKKKSGTQKCRLLDVLILGPEKLCNVDKSGELITGLILSKTQEIPSK